MQNLLSLADGDVGTVGDKKSVYGIYGSVSLSDGTVWRNLYADYTSLWMTAPGAVDGDAFAHFVEAGNIAVGGTFYGYYLDEYTGLDYGYYQNGTAPNYLGGGLQTDGILTGNGGISHGSPTELTIDASGIITVTKGYHRVDTFADAATDDLVTINDGVDGELLVLRAENDARTVVLKDGGGNLALAGDFSLDNVHDTISLIYDATLALWLETSRSDNGA